MHTTYATRRRPAPPLTFSDLLAACPTIAQLRDDCLSIAQHAAHDWYPRWLGGSSIFAQALADAAKVLGEPAQRGVVLAGLLDVYQRERSRRRK